MGWIIATIVLSMIITAMGLALINLLKKNEKLEDFITKQSDAINECNKRIKEIDTRGTFSADDEIGWFFKGIKEIQELINEYNINHK